MKKSKTWRQIAARIIAEVLAGLPGDATLDDKKTALRAAYPFGARRHWPYRAWCRAKREALKMGPKTDEAPLFLEVNEP